MEREKHINTDDDVTGCMLCIIPNTHKGVFNHPNGNHRQKVNTVIKTRFSYLSDYKFHDNIDTF